MLLIFDLDGTVIDSRSCIVKATQAAFRFHELEEPEENEVAGAMGIPLEVTFPRWSGQKDAADLIATYRRLYAEMAGSELTVFGGMREALSVLGTRHTLTIATSKKRSVADHNLELMNLRDLFVMVLGSDDVSNYKPHPESIHRVRKAFPFDPSESVMIGDARADIDMGHAAGVQTCAAIWGAHDADELVATRPTMTANHPSDLVGLFAMG
ncbi:MAG: HAD family hydrolase [Armatimonadetes bacterium]|nr:HAD family hydrolase [Armatimonadota bacterium]